jgi:hypothetical protein
MGTDEVLRMLLMYFVLPVWLAAGFADYLCHRAAHIEETSGWRESILHLLQFGEMAVPVLAALFLEITSSVILMMTAFLILHQATAMWDVRYAAATREVSPIEQHIHSLLEMLPLTGFLLVIALHWPAFTALFGYGTPDFSLALKQQPLPVSYIVTMLVLTALLEVLPYLEELMRGLHRRRTQLKPPPTRVRMGACTLRWCWSWRVLHPRPCRRMVPLVNRPSRRRPSASAHVRDPGLVHSP